MWLLRLAVSACLPLCGYRWCGLFRGRPKGQKRGLGVKGEPREKPAFSRWLDARAATWGSVEGSYLLMINKPAENLGGCQGKAQYNTLAITLSQLDVFLSIRL